MSTNVYGSLMHITVQCIFILNVYNKLKVDTCNLSKPKSDAPLPSINGTNSSTYSIQQTISTMGWCTHNWRLSEKDLLQWNNFDKTAVLTARNTTINLTRLRFWLQDILLLIWQDCGFDVKIYCYWFDKTIILTLKDTFTDFTRLFNFDVKRFIVYNCYPFTSTSKLQTSSFFLHNSQTKL